MSLAPHAVIYNAGVLALTRYYAGIFLFAAVTICLFTFTDDDDDDDADVEMMMMAKSILSARPAIEIRSGTLLRACRARACFLAQ